MVVYVPDLGFSPGIVCVTGVIHVALVNLFCGETSEGPRMGLHKLLKELKMEDNKSVKLVNVFKCACHMEYTCIHVLFCIAIAYLNCINSKEMKYMANDKRS
jgi:hypothetical protein